ncbi:MAG: sigma-70 family RNA polymerase sigma factor [Solirubrobacteraceae bacterium]
MLARDHPECFGDLFVAYREPLLRFFAREVMDPETAWDLMAETFAEAFSSMHRFRGSTDAEGRAWLWAIARHDLYRWRERGAVGRRRLAKLGIDPIPMSDAEFEHVEELADLERMSPAITAALHALPLDQQNAIRLRIIDGLDYEDVATRLGISTQLARSRVSRGLRALAQLLSQHDAISAGRTTT